MQHVSSYDWCYHTARKETIILVVNIVRWTYKRARGRPHEVAVVDLTLALAPLRLYRSTEFWIIRANVLRVPSEFSPNRMPSALGRSATLTTGIVSSWGGACLHLLVLIVDFTVGGREKKTNTESATAVRERWGP